MNKLKPHQSFWLTALLVLIIAVISYFDEEAVIDINIHDTYFIIHYFHLAILLVLFFTISGLVYWLFYKAKITMVKQLSKFHVYMSIGCVFISFFVRVFSNQSTSNDFPLYDDISNHVIFIMVLFILLICAQLLFFLNLILSSFNFFRNKL